MDGREGKIGGREDEIWEGLLLTDEELDALADKIRGSPGYVVLPPLPASHFAPVLKAILLHALYDRHLDEEKEKEKEKETETVKEPKVKDRELEKEGAGEKAEGKGEVEVKKEKKKTSPYETSGQQQEVKYLWIPATPSSSSSSHSSSPSSSHSSSASASTLSTSPSSTPPASSSPSSSVWSILGNLGLAQMLGWSTSTNTPGSTPTSTTTQEKPAGRFKGELGTTQRRVEPLLEMQVDVDLSIPATSLIPHIPENAKIVHKSAADDQQKKKEIVKVSMNAFHWLVALPPVVGLCQRLMGKDFILGDYSANVLFPGCPAGAVHRDYPYWSRPLKALGLHLRDLPISRILELQMIVALDEFTAQNGATGLIPGSHLWKMKDKRAPQGSGEFWERADLFLVPAGSILVGHGCVLHASGGNNSDKPRTALLAQYLASDVKRMRAYLDHMDKTPSVWDNASQPLKSMLAPRDAS